METVPRKQIPVRFGRGIRLLSLWLLLDIGALSAFLLCRGNRALMNAWTTRVASPLQAALGRLCAYVPFSVMELLITLLVLGAAVFLVRGAYGVAKARGERLRKGLTLLLGTLCAALCLAAPVSEETLQAVAAYFADGLAACADSVARDENGAFAVSRADILAEAPYIYDTLETIYPFLTFDDTGVKPMAFSRLMSRMDFTGFYCACTGEANINVDSPACLLASTAAHEMAHQRGFASEQECNFLAVVSCLTSGRPVYVYSGWLMGWIYLGNALYSVNPDAYRELRDTLPETVRIDLARNNAYWNQFRDSVVKEVSTKAYDRILKSYGEERGMQSYGAMVDLLAAYYGNA